jgi:hypothetical protein
VFTIKERWHPRAFNGCFWLPRRSQQKISVAKFGDKVWVLHSFVKKARKTPEANLDFGIKRYKDLLKRLNAMES